MSFFTNNWLIKEFNQHWSRSFSPCQCVFRRPAVWAVSHQLDHLKLINAAHVRQRPRASYLFSALCFLSLRWDFLCKLVSRPGPTERQTSCRGFTAGRCCRCEPRSHLWTQTHTRVSFLWRRKGDLACSVVSSQLLLLKLSIFQPSFNRVICSLRPGTAHRTG